MGIKTDDVYSSEIAPSLRSYVSFENLLEDKKSIGTITKLGKEKREHLA